MHSSVIDTATVTPTPAGFTADRLGDLPFFPNIACTGTGTAAGGGALVGGAPPNSNPPGAAGGGLLRLRGHLQR